MPTPSPAGTFSNGPASASSKEHKSSSYFSNRQTLLSPLPSPVPGVHAQPNGSAVPGIARRTSSAGSGIAPTASHPSSLIGLGPPPSGANLGGKKHSLSLSLSTSAAAAHSAPHPPGSTTPGSAWGGGSGGPGGAGPWASGGSAGGTPGERGRNGGTTPTLGAGGWSAAQSAHSGRDRWSAVFGSGVGTIGTGTGTNNTNGSATGSGTGSVSGAICTGGGRGTSPSSRRGTPPITPGAGGPTSASPSAIAAVPTAAQQQNGELHPLRYTWTLFFLHRAPGGRKGAPLLDGTIAGAGGIAVERYEEGMRKVASFGSVESFWPIYAHIKRPSSLRPISDYHLFKQGVRPLWEDEANRKGGKWIVRLRKGVADRLWEELILALIGDQFEASEQICGAVLSIRAAEDVLSVWNRDEAEGRATLRIRDALRRLLQLPPQTPMEYKAHSESLAERGSGTGAGAAAGTGAGSNGNGSGVGLGIASHGDEARR